MTRIQSNVWHTYRGPLALAIISMSGLGAALVGDGLLDIVGWTFLLVPLLTAAYHIATPQRD